MGELISLPSRAKNETTAVLEDLTAVNQTYPIRDMIVIAGFATGDPRIGLSGRYLTDPDTAIAAIRKLEQQLKWTRSLQA